MSQDASGGVDLELKKAFEEMQMKVRSTSYQLKVSDLQIDKLKREIAKAKLVNGELETLPDDTKTYESVGRMFLLKPKNELQKNLATSVEKYEDSIRTCQTNSERLQKSLKESEDNLRELVSSRQKQK